MDHRNREVAILAKKMALEKMEKRDFMGARRCAHVARKLCPDLENIVQMILVCDVHCYANERVCGNEMDWYKILQIEKTADEALIKRQYNRLVLSLHPDKNRFPGAAGAFQLIQEAKMVLLDGEKRRSYDSMCQAEVLWDEPKGTSSEGSKGRKRRSGFEGSMRDCRRKRASKKDNVVEDDEVEIDHGVKKSKTSRSFNVRAQEDDKEGKREAKFTFNAQENGKMVEDDGVEIERGVKKSKVRKSFNDSAQELDKQIKRAARFVSKTRENGKMVEDDADNIDGLEIERGVKKAKNSKSFNVQAQEDAKQGKRGAKFASKTQENGKMVEDDADNMDGVEIERAMKKSKVRKSFDDSSQEVDKQGKGAAKFASGIALDSKILEYLGAEFNDFDTERGKTCFGAGQIWATYDTLDAMPRFYALINKVISQDFKLQITWLEPYPHRANERKWLYQGLPTSCGRFKLGYSEIIEDHAIFSHLVTWRKHINFPNIYEIHPRKGETWALFKNWDFEWYKNRDSHKVYEFEVVEILSDYDSKVGVSMTFLRRIEGFTSLFCRVKEEEVDFEVIGVEERFRFSHKVPSVEMKCREGLNGIKRFFELDPASLPRDLSSH